MLGNAAFTIGGFPVRVRPGFFLFLLLIVIGEFFCCPSLTLADEAVLRPGPRVEEGIATLARALHPSLEMP